MVVGYEVAGTVSALGAGVEGFSEGDRVMAGTRFGGYAERVVAKVGRTPRRCPTSSPSSRARRSR